MFKADELYVNMGPQHPSTHGVLHLGIKTDGEIVKDVRPHIGYLHRCFEKSAEGVKYSGVIPFTDRMDYVGAIGNEWPAVLGIERLLGQEVPPRGEWIRVVAAELQRIASHLIAFGTYGIDMGALTPFFWAFRERERVLDVFERMSGARLLYNYVRPGGVMRDLDPRTIEMARAICEEMLRRLPEYDGLLTYNKIFLQRTTGVGVVSREVALSYNLTGPNLRACGTRWDLRRDDPYSVYPEIEFDVPVGIDDASLGAVKGDSWNRYRVRLLEIEQSCRIVLHALDRLPAGDSWKRPKVVKPKPGEVYARAEAPRGEIGFYVIADGTDKPFRFKAKSPSFCALSGFHAYAKDHLIADVVATLGSIDIVLGEVDR